MARYRKKPVVIDAIQWHEETMFIKDVLDHFGGMKEMGISTIGRSGRRLFIRTLEGEMSVGDGDWIIKGVNGELYPCKPDIFEKTYELVEETA